MADWKILREYPVDDAGAFVDLQTLDDKLPPVEIFINGGTIQGFLTTGTPDPSRTRMVVTFLDAFKKYLVEGSGPEGRGTFDFQFIEAIFEREANGEINQDTLLVIDSVASTGGLGYRATLVPELSDGQLVTVRLFNVVPPPGTQFIRIFYREV